MMKKYSLIITAIYLMFGSLNVLAKDYKVEVLIFKNLSEQKSYESSQYAPPNEMVSGSNYWAVEPSMLNEQARLINESSGYRLVDHLSWGQESLPYRQSTAVPLSGNPDGWFKVYANHLLYVNIDLDFAGYRMEEKRRIKLDEQHFFDHPKFGLLVQVSRLAKPKDEPETKGSIQ